MHHLISVTLLLSVVCGIKIYIPHRYHFVNENKTWSEAQTYCRGIHTDLATINNMDEMMKLKDTLKEETVVKAWIGLHREGTGKWQWSLADQTFYRDGDTYRNWGSGEPDNYGGNEYCVTMLNWVYNSGRWFDLRCNFSFPFVCYDEKKTGTDKYIIINEPKTWFDAQIYCREKHTDLVSVRNQTENDQIWNMTRSSVSVGIWIGLYNDSWKWSDQSNSLFGYWSYDLYNDDTKKCAAVKKIEEKQNLTWNNETCDTSIPFICHENKLILIKENLTWWASLNYCRNHHHDLVSVRTEETQLWVKEAVQGASTEHVWLGLRHDCAQRIWFWVCGSMICYQDWALGNGTGLEDCSQEKRSGALQSGGKQQWIVLPESYKLNFICSLYDDIFW